MLLPLVQEWKADKAAALQESRGPSAVQIGLGTAAATGLGLAGWAAFNALKKQGLSDEAAAAKAAQAAAETQSAAQSLRATEPGSQNVRRREHPHYNGPALRAPVPGRKGRLVEKPQAIPQDGRKGGELAREQGQYKARTAQGFHDPAVAALNTPEKRAAYLAGVADVRGMNSDEFKTAQRAIAAMEATTPSGVDPRSYIDELSSQARYGTATADEVAQSGGFMAQSRTKSNKSAQAGYQGRESAPQTKALIYDKSGGDLRALLNAAAADSPGDMGATLANSSRAIADPSSTRTPSFGRGKPVGIDPAKASVFFQDADGSLQPYLGSRVITTGGGDAIYSGKRSDGSPIAESDLVYLPTDDSSFYQRSDLSHPVLSADDIAANADAQINRRYATEEDQAIKGMREPLPSTDPRFSTGVTDGDVSDNWTLARVQAGGDRVPLDVSGFQSEASRQGAFAVQQLIEQRRHQYHQQTGEWPVEALSRGWAQELAPTYSTTVDDVLRASAGTAAPAPVRGPRQQTHALAGGSSRDVLDRVYTSLGMHARSDAWEMEAALRAGDIGTVAESLAAELPGLTAAHGGALGKLGHSEKLNVVAEGVSAGLKDLTVVLNKYPQMAEQFGIGKGQGGFGLDAYLKSYVRDFATVRGMQLNGDQPSYIIPNDAYELIAHRGSQNGRSTLEQLEDELRGSPNGMAAALKLDRMVSSAQSTKEADPNANATRFAQTVFEMSDPEMVSTQLVASSNGAVKISAGTRRPQDVTAGFYDRNPNEAQIAGALEDLPLGAPVNATLRARLKGIDTRAPGAAAQRQDVEAAQRWITEHAEQLEAERADFNRGIVRRAGVPVSAGRGFLIDSGDRGVFLAGDTQGLNTSYREELTNDFDTTPLDQAQDNAREAKLNNQIDLETAGVGFGGDGYAGSAEAQKTAREYSGTKLKFKNLGANGASAMPAGEAYYPRQMVRRYLADLEADRRVALGLDQVLGSSWQAPDLSVSGSFLNEDNTYRSRDDVPVNLTREWTAGDTPSQNERDHDPRQQAGRLKVEVQGPARPPAQPGVNGAIDPYASYGTRGITSNPRPPITDFDELAALTGKTPRSQVAALDSAATAIAHQTALRARAGTAGEAFRDDQNFRDALSDQAALASGAIERQRQANAAIGAQALQLAHRAGGYSGGELSAPVRQPTAPGLFDRGEVSGLGRRGSTFEQEPLAPIPSAAAAAPQVTGYSAQELDDARARHVMGYIESAATPDFDKRGRQTRGWADGDSWHGGARLAGRADRNVGAYVPPSDAMTALLAGAARRRGMV